jgi:hypothetical protein
MMSERNAGISACPRNPSRQTASIQAMAERLFRAIGRDDTIADTRFCTNNVERARLLVEREAAIIAREINKRAASAGSS